MADIRKYRLRYFAIAAGALVVAMIIGWTAIASQIDNFHYDWTLRLYPPVSPAREAVVLEVDDQTLIDYGGRRGMRMALARGLERLAEAGPKAVALDFILADASDSSGSAEDEALAAAMRKTPNLVLSSDIIPNAARWQPPIPLFRQAAKATGHVHADQDRYDGVIRQVQLEKVAEKTRLWAIALETFRLARGVDTIVESPDDLAVGSFVIAAPRRGQAGRPLLIRYRRDPIPKVSIKRLIEEPAAAAELRGKVVFAGITSQSEARDKWTTPYSNTIPTPGVEIHAQIYETLAHGEILQPASNFSVAAIALLLAAAAGAAFAAFFRWPAYVAGTLLIACAHSLPHVAFKSGVVFPLVAPAAAAWLAVIGCAAYRYFVVSRQLEISEADRARYQQAIHFVSHEMRSPLTAIQGSSELMSRYNLSEEKRKQIAQMINSESKRMARMIQTFLDVERLSAGQMELKKEPFSLLDVVIISLERARPLADRKRIVLQAGDLAEDEVLGDKELMEYAVYNLLTNAIKYSPPGTQVTVEALRDGGQLRVAVRDQGIGMDKKELQKIGTKFFRTRRAEASGESGTGIGLSIVSQIVQHHGGKMEVTSVPEKGSCFTLVVPVSARAAHS